VIQVNENYIKLKAGYLFPEIAKRVKMYSQSNESAEIIKLGIGDVTEPLPKACIEAMGKALDDMGTQYRSAIYYKNENNIKTILASKEQYQTELNKKNLGVIETEIKKIDSYFYAEQNHQQYLASPRSRQYCSASPTKVKLGVFTGSNYKLEDHIWENFNWEVDKCVLRSDNNPIKNNS